MTPNGPIRAPELTGAIAWLNVPAPLTLTALRGKVVLLDFWTYGCINCIHILPDLKKLKRDSRTSWSSSACTRPSSPTSRPPRTSGRSSSATRSTHPVVNDAEFRIWRAYTVRAWPTLVIIDPAGYIVGAASGEGKYEGFEQAIAAVITVFDERGEIDRRPLATRSESDGVADDRAAVSRQGRWRADGRLFISDSNHHRIVVADVGGQELDRIGTGQPGQADGGFDVAAFHKPQGLAWIDRQLWVADTENHALRALDFDRRCRHDDRRHWRAGAWQESGGAALAVALNSPWDLVEPRRAGLCRDGRITPDLDAGCRARHLWPYAGIGTGGAGRWPDR